MKNPYAWVNAMIKEEGRQVEFVQFGKSQNPDKPWTGSGQPSIIKRIKKWVVFIPPYDAANNMGMVYVPEDLLKRFDHMVIAEPFKDALDYNAIIDDGDVLNIIWQNLLKPGRDGIALVTLGVKR